MKRVLYGCFPSLLFLIGASFCAPAYAQKEQLVILTTFSQEPLLPLVAEFNKIHQDLEVKLLHRRTSSSIQLLSKSYIDDIDLILTSSPYLMSHLIKADKLVDMPLKLKAPEWLMPYVLPSTSKVVTIGYSGAGIVWNQDYFDGHQLPLPQGFSSLVAPAYFGHVTMSTPSRSGTTQMMLESVLTQYGWDDGWQIILNVAANFATISSRSFGVSDTISRGGLGVGPTIDSYAHILQRKLDYVQFSYDKDFTLMPTYVGMIKQTASDKHALAFIEMLLSDKIQSQILKNSFSKYSINDDQLLENPHVSLNVETLMRREIGINLLFDIAITKRLAVLSDTWLAIIHSEQRSQLDPDKLLLIQKAKERLFSMPISISEFDAQMALFSKLQRDQSAEGLAQFRANKEEWLHHLGIKLSQNQMLANDLLKQLNGSVNP